MVLQGVWPDLLERRGFQGTQRDEAPMTAFLIACLVSSALSVAFAFRFARNSLDAAERSLVAEQRILKALDASSAIDDGQGSPYRTPGKPSESPLLVLPVETDDPSLTVVDWQPRVKRSSTDASASLHCECPACDMDWYWHQSTPDVCFCSKVKGAHFHLNCPKTVSPLPGCGFKWVMRSKVSAPESRDSLPPLVSGIEGGTA
jgi:hypothetical protein